MNTFRVIALVTASTLIISCSQSPAPIITMPESFIVYERDETGTKQFRMFHAPFTLLWDKLKPKHKALKYKHYNINVSDPDIMRYSIREQLERKLGNKWVIDPALTRSFFSALTLNQSPETVWSLGYRNQKHVFVLMVMTKESAQLSEEFPMLPLRVISDANIQAIEFTPNGEIPLHK